MNKYVQPVMFRDGAFYACNKDQESWVKLTTTDTVDLSADECAKCPACESPDTISYWDIKHKDTGSLGYRTLHLLEAIHREHYPDARKCVDCEHVWW